MLPDWVSNQGPLTYESGALLIALRGLAGLKEGKKIGVRCPIISFMPFVRASIVQGK